ncbi:MAG: hypothetical protein WCS96_12275, partial [Victivallales bacterium]
IQKVHYTGAGFTYSPSNGKGGGGGASMTPVGVLCLQLMGEGKSREALTGLKYIEEYGKGAWMKCDWKTGGGTLYQWYYQTQALFQGYSGTGGNWDEWNREFQRALMKEQEADGHWSSPSEKYGRGGGLEAAKAATDAKGKLTAGVFASTENINLYVYSTSLCCLMLEVYYRYLPTFKVAGDHAAGAGGGTAAKKEAKDELKIE